MPGAAAAHTAPPGKAQSVKPGRAKLVVRERTVRFVEMPSRSKQRNETTGLVALCRDKQMVVARGTFIGQLLTPGRDLFLAKEGWKKHSTDVKGRLTPGSLGPAPVPSQTACRKYVFSV